MSFVLLLVLCIIPVTRDAEALQAYATVVLDQESVTADPKDSVTETNVTITGNVHCDVSGLGGTVQKVMINLYVRVDEDWRAELAPSTIMFDTQVSNATIFVKVKIPRGTNCDVVANVSVYGDGNVNPGGQSVPVTSDHAGITIKQYFGIDMSLSQNIVQIKSGESVTNFIGIHNQGNGQDLGRIAIVDGAAPLEADGFELFIPNSEIRLFQWQSGTLELRITAPDKVTDERTYFLTLSVTSAGSEKTGEAVYEEIRFEIRAEKTDLSDRILGESCWVMLGIMVVGLVIIIVVVVVVVVRLRGKDQE